ncbi:hypothetical protein [Streptomyces spirodelae]|uniref:Uncharacterized protein n=1 Tax=Streptomyces spirodelae TaxID=2812904 RepID=A0ABS3WW50_9ACTN|nr:hypothetical protein [Streptomyces spirodelae]MBO8187365.1 hypothetical protein [Streptomyces spirodelae]
MSNQDVRAVGQIRDVLMAGRRGHRTTGPARAGCVGPRGAEATAVGRAVWRGHMAATGTTP